MLVRATDQYEKLNLQDNELKRIPKTGEEFEVSEERYKVLTETNKFNAIFVEKVDKEEIKEKDKEKEEEEKEEEEKEEEEKEETVNQTTKKKTTRKKK